MNLKVFRWFVVLFLLFSNFFLWSKNSLLRGDQLIVSVLDVGQGDAILIQAPGGHTALIDGGPGRGILEVLPKQLPFMWNNIDLLIETHPDKDHVGGLPDVANRYAVKGIMKPCIESQNAYDQALSGIAKEKEITEVCATAGQVVNLGGGVQIEILYAGDRKTEDTNGSSVVTKLTFGRSSFLFLGDATIKEQNYLLYDVPDKIDSDIVKISHHGSRESYDQALIDKVSPDVAIISVGKENRYGHPHREVLEKLAQNRSEILRTDQVGTIVLLSDGSDIRKKQVHSGLMDFFDSLNIK